MKPFKILLFLVITLILCLAIAFVFPEKGIQLSENISLNFHWSFKSLSKQKVAYVDISDIIENNEKTILQDSIIEEVLPKFDTIRAEVQKLKAKIQKIEYPSGNEFLLYPFFIKLDHCKRNRVRILHYGDSQIEGDRITGYLRNKFQRQFGGSGPGFMPILPRPAESASIIHKASKNWIKHAVYYKKDTILPHRKFGALGSFTRFTSYKEDTLGSNTSIQNAWVEFSKSGMAYRSVQKFNEINIYYGHCNTEFTAKGYINDSLIWFEILDSIQSTQAFTWDLEKAPYKFKIEFEGIKSPDIYGVSMDSKYGVAVDNLPFRGSSGIEFTKLDYTQLHQMTKNINPGLIILQFGVNVVPYKVKNFNFYERGLTRQIKYLKATMPNTPILVVGVSDMSERKGDYYQTRSNIKKVIKAQRNAAKNADCAYWDLFTAMGGENSMPSWVFAEPSLANKDFIHFNRKGGHIVSQMLYNAIIEEYHAYQNKTNSKKQVKENS